MNDKSYRKNVGLIVLNQKNQLLVCRRKDQQTWQFPQGGIDTENLLEQLHIENFLKKSALNKKM